MLVSASPSTNKMFRMKMAQRCLIATQRSLQLLAMRAIRNQVWPLQPFRFEDQQLLNRSLEGIRFGASIIRFAEFLRAKEDGLFGRGNQPGQFLQIGFDESC